MSPENNFRLSEKVSRNAEKKEGSASVDVETLRPEPLYPILEAAYGNKEWSIRKESYWTEQKWDFLPNEPLDKSKWKKTTLQYYDYLKHIVMWSIEPETRGHLDPAPGIPMYNSEHQLVGERAPDLNNEMEMDMAVAELAKYYFNEGEPEKIKPLIITETEGDSENIAGVITIRWRGDKFIPSSKRRVASLERLIVDPSKRQEGFGLKLTASAIEYAFYGYKGYSSESGNGAEEVRAWIMADRTAGNFQINIDLFMNKLGFRILQSPNTDWRDYAEKIGIITDRNALWFNLKKDEWEKVKKDDDSRIKPYDIINLH